MTVKVVSYGKRRTQIKLLRTGFRGEYLGLRGMSVGNEESFTMSTFMAKLIYSG
jgi:hypothetical protein